VDGLPIANRDRRKSIRCASHDYSAPGAYFLTICTHGRTPLFGQKCAGRMIQTDAGRHLERTWQELATDFPDVVLDEFVVMPDHVHGIVMIADMGMVPNIGDASTVGAIHESPLRRRSPQQDRHRSHALGPHDPEAGQPISRGAAAIP